MVLIDNDILLTEVLIQVMSEVIEKVTDELLDKLISDGGLIDKIVYMAGIPASYAYGTGRRLGKNGGFWGMWDKEELSVSGNTIISTIQEYSERMETDSDNFIHGSNYWIMEDVRDILTDIIVLGKSGPLFGEGYWRQPRDFWTPFIKLLNDGTVDKIIEKNFKLMGIEYKKI